MSIRRFRLALILVIALGTLALASSKEARAPGSDEAFPLLGRIVVVDPGHGGIDPGCHLDDVTEKEISLSVALLPRRRARQPGGQGVSHPHRRCGVELLSAAACAPGTGGISKGGCSWPRATKASSW